MENEKIKTVHKNINFKDIKNQLPSLNGFDPSSVFAVNSTSGDCFPEGACYEYNQKNKQ